MSRDKYELIPTDMRTPDGKPLYRVRALRDFAGIKCGDLGGYVEGEHNLSQDGDAWIHGEAVVSGKGCVSDHPLKADAESMPCHRPGWRPGLPPGRFNRG